MGQPNLRAHLIDWVITMLLSDDVGCLFPAGFQFAYTSSLINIVDKDPDSWLKGHTSVQSVIISCF